MGQQYRAWIGTDLAEHGIAWVVVVRERTTDWCEVGAFLVDAWCLGVKNAYADEMPAADFKEFLGHQLPEGESEEVDPACARKLVEGAVGYAQSFGFLPHREFKKARRVFGSIKSTDCAREFAFGREGRPCFVTGPDDDESRIARVLAILRARLGEDGFDFIDAADTDAMDKAIDELFEFIDRGRLPTGDFTPVEAEGFIAGIVLLPEAIKPSEWLPAFWGGEAQVPVFADEEEARTVSAGVFALYQRVLGEIDEGRYAVVLPPASAPGHTEAAGRFCAGVLRALAMQPKVVSWLRGHPEGGPQLAILESCAAGTSLEPGVDWIHRLQQAVTELDELTMELRPVQDAGPA